jgi:hypothetical protein
MLMFYSPREGAKIESHSKEWLFLFCHRIRINCLEFVSTVILKQNTIWWLKTQGIQLKSYN